MSLLDFPDSFPAEFVKKLGDKAGDKYVMELFAQTDDPELIFNAIKALEKGHFRDSDMKSNESVQIAFESLFKPGGSRYSRYLTKFGVEFFSDLRENNQLGLVDLLAKFKAVEGVAEISSKNKESLSGRVEEKVFSVIASSNNPRAAYDLAHGLSFDSQKRRLQLIRVIEELGASEEARCFATYVRPINDGEIKRLVNVVIQSGNAKDMFYLARDVDRISESKFDELIDAFVEAYPAGCSSYDYGETIYRLALKTDDRTTRTQMSKLYEVMDSFGSAGWAHRFADDINIGKRQKRKLYQK
jgi:hypothetical protein